MSWNYRVVHKTRQARGTDEVVDLYSIREVYYDDDGKPNGWAKASVANWETLDDCAGTLDLMRGALDKPVMEYDSETRMVREPTTEQDALAELGKCRDAMLDLTERLYNLGKEHEALQATQEMRRPSNEDYADELRVHVSVKCRSAGSAGSIYCRTLAEIVHAVQELEDGVFGSWDDITVEPVAVAVEKPSDEEIEDAFQSEQPVVNIDNYRAWFLAGVRWRESYGFPEPVAVEKPYHLEILTAKDSHARAAGVSSSEHVFYGPGFVAGAEWMWDHLHPQQPPEPVDAFEAWWAEQWNDKRPYNRDTGDKDLAREAWDAAQAAKA